MGSSKPPPAPERLPTDPSACDRCGETVELLNVVQPLGSRPGYRIFGCTACKALQWVDVQDGRK